MLAYVNVNRQSRRTVNGSPSKTAASLGCAARQWSSSLTTHPICIIRCEPRFMSHCRKVYDLDHILKCASAKNTTECREQSVTINFATAPSGMPIWRKNAAFYPWPKTLVDRSGKEPRKTRPVGEFAKLLAARVFLMCLTTLVVTIMVKLSKTTDRHPK